MSKTRILYGILLVVATGAMLTGCADEAAGTLPQVDPYPSRSSPAPTDPAPSSPPLATALPTLRNPTAPPRGPSDQIKKTSQVVGTVTRGGSGPCYGLTTDDGTAYALHATDGRQLVKGARVRVQTKPSRLRIDCGPGKLVEMVAVEPLR